MSVLRPSQVRRLTTCAAVVAVVVAGWWLVNSRYWGGQDKTYAEPWSTHDGGLPPPSISPDGRRVTVHFLGGGCFKSASPRLEETSESVTITIEVTDYPDAACSAIGINGHETVFLSEPLGDRELVDGALH